VAEMRYKTYRLRPSAVRKRGDKVKIEVGIEVTNNMKRSMLNGSCVRSFLHIQIGGNQNAKCRPASVFLDTHSD
jgi:hypothetical protein